MNSESPNVELGDHAAHSPAIHSDYSEYCKTLEPLQATLPTPHELLAELAEKGVAVAGDEISFKPLDPQNCNTLCRIALDFHYSSGQPPLGSVVPASASVTVILGTIQDALALLRTAHSLPISHFHQFITSASELVILLLTCVPDISQVPTTQAMLHFSDANELLLTYSLAPDVRQVLDTFVMSLTLLIGDDAKATREAQMMHTIQLTLGKGDILGPSSDTDTITLGLLLNYMVRIFTCLFLLLRFSLLPVVYLPLLLPLFQIAFADAVFWLVTERLPTGRMNTEQVMSSMRWRSLSRASAGHPGRQPSVTRSCYYPHLHV